ncbi:hypothetical protein [Devriesea agamarum]|uniref:hypothetical protein n=1 Tax=Devriesea agamarum TaxID=472569 RepID=UPI00071D6695|nr:hypothetical protein [Devriesea agamarum]
MRRLLAFLATLLLCAVVAAPASAAWLQAPGVTPTQGDSHPSPVRLVLTTAGLTWEDISPTRTPALQCLADHAGIAAMSTTSSSAISTYRQGVQALHTGYRGIHGLAGHAAVPGTLQGVTSSQDATASSGGSDASPIRKDLLATYPGGLEEIPGPNPTAEHLSTESKTVATALANHPHSIVLVHLGGLPAHPSATDLAALDTRVSRILDAAGGCSQLPRTILASVAVLNPPKDDLLPTESLHDSLALPAPNRLQVVMDTGYPGTLLSSGSTHQNGLVSVVDLLPTLMEPTQVPLPSDLPGSACEAGPAASTAAAQQLVRDRTLAAQRIGSATLPVLGIWGAPCAIATVLLWIPRFARGRRRAAFARALAIALPPATAAGLIANLVPWWRAELPWLALAGFTWSVAAVITAIALLGPWRRHRLGPPAASGLITAGIILGESAFGSPLQTSAILGADPLGGGRFYGISNHLFGIVLACSLLALLGLLTWCDRLTPGADEGDSAASAASRSRLRVAMVAALGAVVSVICVAPTMGADFGSMLVCLPVFGLLALLVSRVRLRLWHVLVLGGGGALAVIAVALADWMRAPEQRTHLGRFIDAVLTGDLWQVIGRKLSQNIGLIAQYPLLAAGMVLLVLLSLALLFPGRARWARLSRLISEVPVARPVVICLIAGSWLGFAVNDTGPLLVVAAGLMTAPLLTAMLPDPVAHDDSA